MATKTKAPRDLGPNERAVYELVQIGRLTAAHLPLYRRPLQALERAGLIERGTDGVFRDVATPGAVAARPSPSSRPPPMGTLVVRVPKDVISELDRVAEGRRALRSEVARDFLLEALTRPRPATL